MSNRQEYLAEIDKQFPQDPASWRSFAADFAVFLAQANDEQNLSRNTDPVLFCESHYTDARQLALYLEEFAADKELCLADLGSGNGVPGLLCAGMIGRHSWILIEAEGRKCEFLNAALKMFHVEHVKVLNSRIEKALKEKGDTRPQILVARALGKIEKIYGWVEKCSTWNKIILFKSRGWDEEWRDAQRGKAGKKLTLSQNINYSDSSKDRRLVVLKKL